MLAKHRAILCHKLSVRKFFSTIPLNKGCIIPVGHKTDILTVRLVGIDKIHFIRNLTDLRFAVIAKWKQRVGKLLLCQVVEHIALVLRLIQSLF